MVHEKNNTIKKKCKICDNFFLAPKSTEAIRTVYCCSDTCRGHYYRNIKDTEKIELVIKTGNISTLRCSLQRVLDLGFKIKITK